MGLFYDEKLDDVNSSFVDSNFKFNKGHYDFNGLVNLKNKKNNRKFYVYDKSGKKVKTDKHGKMEIIEIIKNNKEQLIVYSDSHHNVSFVKSKIHKVLTPQQIADKVEKHPMTRTFLFMFLSSLWVFGVLRFRDYSFKNIQLSLGYRKTINHNIHFLFPKSIRSKYAMSTNKISLILHFYWVRIPLKNIYNNYISTSEINNPLYIKIINDYINYYYVLKKKTKDAYDKRNFIFNTRSIKIFNTNIEMYVRKSITGQFVLVVTTAMKKTINIKEYLAFILTLFIKNKNIYDIYFEKFAQGASESGFELFKYAAKNNRNSLYILDKENSNYYSLKQKYGKKLLAKNSFRSFFYIFLARSFISSDLVTHVQRRLYDNDRLIKRKILDSKNKIFLQHGVSLATDVFERGYYNKKVPISPDYIIVNSNYEKNLFIKKSNYTSNDLIVSGLPNIDLYVKSRNQLKDEITFLLTWRPWDLTGKIEKGSYIYRYKQFINTIEKDSFYKNIKVNVILHPKAKTILKEQFPEFYKNNQHYFYEGDIKDALLKSKVLISDYSSVTFMSFAGGSNIIFYWEDKEKCEREYGSPNILQKRNSFGDIIYKFNDLNKAIQKNYIKPQNEFYKRKFDILVECTDGNNTINAYNSIMNILEKNSHTSSKQVFQSGLKLSAK